MKDTVKIEKECHLGFVSDSSMTVEYVSDAVRHARPQPLSL